MPERSRQPAGSRSSGERPWWETGLDPQRSPDEGGGRYAPDPRYGDATYPAGSGERYPADAYGDARYGDAQYGDARYPDARYPDARYAQAQHGGQGGWYGGSDTTMVAGAGARRGVDPSPWADQLAGGGARPGGPSRGGPSKGGPGKGGSGKGRPDPQRRRRVRRTVASVLVGGLVVSAGVGVYLYEHLNANLRSLPLFAGIAGNAGTEKADPFGRVPINILLIGSDSRANKANCHLGGDCGAGANADVEMVVHVSADRSNATVMSVPRDTVTQLPACTSPTGATMAARLGQINSSLAYGPGCTVAAVHQLTGIPIDHFVMVDFSGVIAMSDAAGGASVCVTRDVYDPYSHLKLSQGTHTLKGLGALEFVRSRHAFGDGSDLGRTYAQHIFLSAVIRNLKSAGVLANPATLYSLANAATKALTVDTGLGSVSRLLGLATDLDKVPTSRIVFTTMQNEPDPTNRARVVPAPAARTLFQTIANDQPLTKAKAKALSGTSPSGAASAGAAAGNAGTGTGTGTAGGTVARSQIAVRVQNASGLAGRASTVAKALIAAGFSPATTFGTAVQVSTTTTLEYGPGRQAAAQAVAAELRLPASALKQGMNRGVTLLIGTDWTSGTTYSGAGAGTGATPAPTVDTGAALNQAHAQTADQSGSCATVSTFKTVVVRGVPMTPSRAFAVSRGVPLSAP